MTRLELTDRIAESDLYLNLSNMNWIPELQLCRRRALIDTDPVFTQIGAHGIGGPFSTYHVLFTYGENVSQPGCVMPTAGVRWVPTRQPVVLDLWEASPGDPSKPFTTITNWSSIGECRHEGKLYGQKDREFIAYFSFPRWTGLPMEIAGGGIPPEVHAQMSAGGWTLTQAGEATRSPAAYRDYIRCSRAEFSVAKHGYVVSQCGWFSDRSTAYLAMGRPVVLQDTGFSRFIQSGRGVVPFRTPDEALAGVNHVVSNYDEHCREARALVEEHFSAPRVLQRLLEDAL
jgi:hypothetical protein